MPAGGGGRGGSKPGSRDGAKTGREPAPGPAGGRRIIAHDVTEDARRAQIELQERLAAALGPLADALRWQRGENVHLTLHFLGDVERRLVSELTAALERAARDREPFEVRIEDIGVFPDARRPRVLWAGIAATTGLDELHRAVGAELEGLGFPLETRPFHPHLTLAYARRGQSPRRLRDVGAAISACEVGEIAAFPVTRIKLYRSDLRPDGPGVRAAGGRASRSAVSGSRRPTELR